MRKMDSADLQQQTDFTPLFERHPDAVLEVENGKIKRANFAACRFLSANQDELVGESLHTLFPDTHHEVLDDLLKDPQSPRKHQTFPLRKDFGKQKLTEVTLLNEPGNGQNSQFVLLQFIQGIQRKSVMAEDELGPRQKSLRRILNHLANQLSVKYVLLSGKHEEDEEAETILFLEDGQTVEDPDILEQSREVFELVDGDFEYYRSSIKEQEGLAFFQNYSIEGFAGIRFKDQDQDQMFCMCVFSESSLGSGSDVLDQLHHFAQKVNELFENSLTTSDVNYRILFDHNPVPLWIYDTDTLEMLDVNQSALDAYGYTREEFLELEVRDLHPAEETMEEFLSLEERWKEGHQMDLPQQTSDGNLMNVEIATTPVQYEEQSARLVSVRDVTRQKRALRKLERRLDYDELTELPNRTYFQKALSDQIEATDVNEGSIGVFYLDIDNFNKINDVLGHSFGDRVLVSISQRLKNCMPRDGVLARWAGDEFIGLLPNLETTDELEELVQKLREVLTTPIELENRKFHLDCSVGLALYPQDGNQPEELIGKADVAMSRAQDTSGEYFEYFIEGDLEETSKELKLVNDIQNSLHEDRFELYYQPFIDCSSGQMYGCEALIRWNHPERGLVQPGSFVPTAEATGLIVPIGKWVLKRACEQVVSWNEERDEDLFVSVNIAVQQIQMKNFVSHVETTLDETGAKPRNLQVELTENTLMNNIERGNRLLCKLQEMGVRVAIDDFGTGYSSLEYLMRLPVDLLKLDRSFTDKITEEPYVMDLFHLVNTMSKRLDMDVLVEGVETREQFQSVVNQNCNYIQGFLFGEPCPADKFIKTLENEGFVSPEIKQSKNGRS